MIPGADAPLVAVPAAQPRLAPGAQPLLGPVARPRLTPGTRRMLWIALILSAAIHLGLLLAFLIGPAARVPGAPPQGEATVDLIMQQDPTVNYGGGPTQPPPQPAAPAPPTPPAKPTPPTPTPPTPTPPTPTPPTPAPPAPPVPTPPIPTPPPPPPAATAVPMPPPPPAARAVPMPPRPPAQARAAAPPAATPAPPEPAAQPDADASAAVHLGDAGFSAGHAEGQAVVPAKPDAGFRNLPPRYPLEAKLHGEQGTVGLLIHVTPLGTAGAVDIATTSGYPALDRAARDSVLRWHFNPEQKDGIPVSSELPFNMIFELDGR